MLAHPYGYPMVMSSYEFEDDGQGPTDSSPRDNASGCGRDWVCEHRRESIANMVAFRKATAGTGLVNWQIIDETVLSFGRGDKGHIVINTSDAPRSLDLPTDLPVGGYCDLITGCGGAVATVDGEGVLRVTVGANRAVAVHTGTRIGNGLEALMADWQNSGVIGELVYWQNVESQHLDHKRHVGIWLPPGYDDDSDTRYKVIYMHDGQNLFDPRLSFAGIDWGVDEAMMRGIEAGRFEPAIVVGVWNSPDRSPEYSPWHGAPDYARFLIEELMPRVDAEFRTLAGPHNTSVMGSSMGGLLSYYLVKNHPNAFGACGCVSTHFALSESDFSLFGGDDIPYIVRDIEDGDTVPKGVRFSFDYGTETLDTTYEEDHKPVREWLLGQGLVEGQDFQIRKYEGAAHSEAEWRARVEDQLEWILGGV
jgi:pimeloyl-ACP methyl ester carboxylesterase